jgi:hypothetical protein
VDIDSTELATDVGAALRNKHAKSLKEKRKEKKLKKRKPKNQIAFTKRKPSVRRQPRI